MYRGVLGVSGTKACRRRSFLSSLRVPSFLSQNASVLSSSGTLTCCSKPFVAMLSGMVKPVGGGGVVEEFDSAPPPALISLPAGQRERQDRRSHLPHAYLPPCSLRGLGAALLRLQLEPRSYTMMQQQVYHTTTNWQRIRA